ncbi:UNVERIFIED_CONTAM: hypothetical protein KB574_04730 [Streptococcus canis]|uniref:WD40 repeat domain-containing protein n=1 Tax=Streptococcus canis FSL Z3-227 TaxID=482234 RepID=A0AAV3FUN7_STRCB|nr:hypothetical protein [Streptococcus canis]EIQ82831.1 hypothetical protein SCAZ3_10730 [Streptococcus canis FSL Z3-227]MDV5988420.1 hypothetical protein [Streptococcus canis]MDV5992895.1 hypothetical protein [Streptococcus canis]MDV6022231.1 hypothetical protein [Streptococcus canis]MDW7798963.1 hypothetical protein [Streptococcus canis]
MRVQKSLSDTLPAAYAVCRLHVDEADFLLVASEVDGACFAYDLNRQLEKQVIWQDIGGTMSIVQVPGSMDFLATQKFYPGFDAKGCQIVYGSFNGKKWDIQKITDFPYLHRFDVIETPTGEQLFIGCTIANSKSFVEDWSDKGRVFVGRFNKDLLVLEDIQALPLRLLKNHGYCNVQNQNYSLITAVEGVVKLTYPYASDTGDWCLDILYGQETSDIVQLDINQDGEHENMIIQGFHGDRLRIFSHDFSRELYHYPDPTPFGHAIWSGSLSGVPCFIFGWRSEKAELRVFTYTDGDFQSHLVEAGVASSNCLAFDKDGKSYLFSANNGSNQVALYELSF